MPIRARANGGRGAADAVADVAGAADRKRVLPDRSPTNSGRFRRRRQPARSPISTGSLRSRRRRQPIANPHAESLRGAAVAAAGGRNRHAPACRRPRRAGSRQGAARRRSTVREKVSFGSSSRSEPAAAAHQPAAEPAAPRRSTEPNCRNDADADSPVARDGGHGASAAANRPANPELIQQKTARRKPGGFCIGSANSTR